jgi:hypothetical protein
MAAMQHNPWKLATIGLALMGTTALGTGLTTAWMMRPTATATAQETAVTPPAPVARMAPSAPASPLTQAVQRNTTAPVTRVSTPVRPVSTAAADCGTNGDRVMRIAKPGLIGALLGAGAGAATGAIANGGKAAGKGALIGGLAGTALGAGYGAYKTKNECGTVFNFNGGSAPSYAGSSAPAPQAALSDGKGITVYNVR